MTGMTTAPGSLILDHVSFRYARTCEDSGLDATPNPEDPIEDPMDITDLCLHVRPGETVLLCGESGCGKTTVTRLANGLIPHYHPGRLTGGVIVDGIDVPRTTIDALAGHVGSVFSNPHTRFFATRVDDELAFPCENMAIAPDEILRRMDGTMRDFAIAELADRNIDHLSGGQQQRVACASASMTDPAILVLDEPTSNLDVPSIARLRRSLLTWRRQGRTILIAEHRLAWLAGIVDRAVVLHRGRVHREMSGEELRALGPEERHALGRRATSIRKTSDARAELPAHAERPSCAEEPSWTVSGVRRRYRGDTRPALDIPELRIPDSRTTIIVGDNGAGKSTFLRWMQGLDRHASGTLTSPAGDTLSRRERLRRCFTVMQDVTQELFTPRVIEEVAASQPTEDPDEAMRILADLDLSDLADRHPLSLSGGQRQRVAVAAAIASNRPIIMFDEPSSGLDHRHMLQVADQLRLLASRGRTVIVVTHDPDLASLAGDNMVELDAGRIGG